MRPLRDVGRGPAVHGLATTADSGATIARARPATPHPARHGPRRGGTRNRAGSRQDAGGSFRHGDTVRGGTGASSIAAPGPRRLPRAVVVLGGVLAFVALAATAVFLYPRSGVAFDQRDWILIADFKNATGEPVFDRSLTTALTAGIQQSKH